LRSEFHAIAPAAPLDGTGIGSGLELPDFRAKGKRTY
jgi:hypothetical protein